MENIRDTETILFAARPDELHDLRHLRAWHHPILGQEIRAKPANRSEGALSAFPKIRPLLLAFGHADPSGVVFIADFDETLYLPVEPCCQAIHLDNENRSRIQRKTEVIGRFDRLRNELVHHFHRSGNDAGGDDVAHSLAGILHALKNAQHRFKSLRSADEPEQHARDDPEHPL